MQQFFFMLWVCPAGLALMRCCSVWISRSSRSAALLWASTSSYPLHLSTSLCLFNFSVASLASLSFASANSLCRANSCSFCSKELLNSSIVRVCVFSCSSKEACTWLICELRPSFRADSSSVLFLSLDRISESYSSFVFCSFYKNSRSFSRALFSALISSIFS